MNLKTLGVALLLLATAFLADSCAPSEDGKPMGPYDVIITNARIIDGTGNPWFRGDVGIRGKRIVTIGDLSGDDAKRTIDAGGNPVTPGFIDLHSHASWSFLVDSRAASAVTQGNTLVVEGEGNSVAPTSESYLAERMSSFERRGITPDWQTLGEFFDRLEASPATINFGTFVGTSNLREIVIGTEDRPARKS